ncbi:uncharacterized protein KY384_005446 [Bacidia gigantensis]|uniref:uncharacterized protein n=1 Tax=Bacidia gigantensis TaxID=2732470 RepID=UPI001D045D07|nr:uncharacterized protein KY384_005446 [Bacidia gigantensis]KAG8529964.1 hypothetical protein KY384_005446 [Bacidia gigantensis]
MSEATERRQIKWSAQFDVLPEAATPTSLKGDRIILPQAALEQLLSAATENVVYDPGPAMSSFDPFNPYSFAAERRAREQIVERQQNLPHPLTFRLVNPTNSRILYAGIREFSAAEDTVGLSSFVRTALGIEEEDVKSSNEADIGHSLDSKEKAKLTIHAQQLPKGTFVKLRPLEAGYDVDDWKALLEQHLRNTFTTLTNGEEILIPAGKEVFRFLVDGLKPNAEAISIVDTDLQVDIEALSEEQARETMQKLAKKWQRAPGTKEGSSAGGSWMMIRQRLVKHRAKPREDHYVFGDLSSRSTKRVKVRHTNTELEDSEAIFISVRGYARESDDTGQVRPIPFSLRVSSENQGASNQDDSSDDVEILQPEEERCSNCHQAVPKRTMFLHQNFCFRNNVLCNRCQNVFLKASEAWNHHWHCPHDDAHGNSITSKDKHDKVPQQGPEDPSFDSAEVLLSGLTPHEVTDGTRTTECHLCLKIVRLRDMAAHLKHHDHQRLSRRKPKVCRNANCGRSVDHVSKTGEVRYQTLNNLDLCNACFGPLYVSQYDLDGKVLRRRVERKYLTQLLTGCNQSWCQNSLCKTGRKNNAFEGPSTVTSKEASSLIKPLLDGLRDFSVPAYFCTDEANQKRRTLAELLAAENGRTPANGKGQDTGPGQDGYQLEWCIAALEVEAGDLDRARSWLRGFAPRIGEGVN